MTARIFVKPEQPTVWGDWNPVGGCGGSDCKAGVARTGRGEHSREGCECLRRRTDARAASDVPQRPL